MICIYEKKFVEKTVLMTSGAVCNDVKSPVCWGTVILIVIEDTGYQHV